MADNSIYARLIVNPAAGAGKTGKYWPGIKSVLNNVGLRFEHDITEAPGHATELARDAVKKGYRVVIPVGGDGTINEVVNGLYAAGSLNDVSLAIIGTGTGGDYIRTVGVSRDFHEACERLVNHPTSVTVDLGTVEHTHNGHKEKRIFANFAGIGFDAEVVRATTVKFKKLGGFPSYLAGLLTTLVRYRNQPVTMTIDGKKEERKICTAIMSIGKYGGGSMFIAPDAEINDGLFDVVVVGDVSKADLLVSFPRIYKGTHLTHPKISVKRAREVEIISQKGIALQADGELLGESPARFSVLPSAMTILV
ncbi:MAG TPA: diacylglycerol kinase family protein [Dehalococcoidales bacterium]|nr:diacylglycerol kinase family protein [Dehalococcoidales bacterium]